MTTYVQIVVNVPAVSGIFDYAIPKSLEGQIGVGHLAIVPFDRVNTYYKPFGNLTIRHSLT